MDNQQNLYQPNENQTPPQSNARKIVIGILVFIGALLFLGFAFQGESNDPTIDTLGDDFGTTDVDSQAKVYDGETVFAAIEGTVAFNSLSEDLFTFGKSQYEPYINNETEVVGFRIDKFSLAQREREVVYFEGKYGSSPNKIKVEVTLLDNARISTSITDSATGGNIDDQLPSNSPYNKFVATLPISEEGYVIEYNPGRDKISITASERDPDLIDKAAAIIDPILDEGDTFNDKVIISLPSTGGAPAYR